MTRASAELLRRICPNDPYPCKMHAEVVRAVERDAATEALDRVHAAVRGLPRGYSDWQNAVLTVIDALRRP